MPTLPATIPNEATLRAEAQTLARFIVGRVAPREFVDRYVAAHQHLFREPAASADSALLALAMRRRWLLPCIDAVLALRRPDALLHKKALLMAAVLEASPEFADDFLPRRCGAIGLAWLSVRVGIATIVQVAIGLPVVMWCERTRSSRREAAGATAS